jgi:phage-related protein
MGIFDVFNDIAKSIKTGVQSAVSKVENGVSSGWKKIEAPVENLGKSFIDKVTGITNTVYNDGRGVVNFIGDQYSKNMDTIRGVATDLGKGTEGLLEGTGKGVEGVGKGLGEALPWIVGGAVAIGGMYFLSGSKRARQMARRSSCGCKSKQNCRHKKLKSN